MIDDPDQKMSLEDCRAIHERTADWLVKDFGAFEQKKEKGVEIVKTAKGSEYSYYLDGTTFIASFLKNLSDTRRIRSEEPTSELQSLMRTSYAVFCLQKKNTTHYYTQNHTVAALPTYCTHTHSSTSHTYPIISI